MDSRTHWRKPMARTLHVSRYTGRRTRNRLSPLENHRNPATFQVHAAISDDSWKVAQSSVQWAAVQSVLEQSTVTHH
jgi:hypothetical protein